MLTGFFVIVGLGILILAHEAGHFFAARKLGMKVEEFGIGFPPRMTAWQRGDVLYSVNWLPFGGFVKIAGENDRIVDGAEVFDALTPEEKQKLYYFRPAWQKSIVLLAGVIMNILAAWLLITVIFSVGTPSVVAIAGIQEGSPAEVAGVMAGDVLVGYERAADFTAFTSSHRGETVEITVQRKGTEQQISVPLRSVTDEQKGAMGVELAEGGITRLPVHKAIWQSVIVTGQIFTDTIVGFGDLLKSLMRANVPQGVVGPVGIFGIAQTASSVGWVSFIQLLAVISINLAVLNLIPFPALDGGRFFMVIIEKVKGTPLSKTFEATVNGVGFLILIGLMLVITFRDVVRLF